MARRTISRTLVPVILTGRKGRKQYCLNGCAQVGGDQFWKLLSAVVAAQQLFIIYLSDQKSIQIVKYRIQQGSTKKLPAKGEHGLNPVKTKAQPRLPGNREKQYDHQTDVVADLLPHHGPHAQAPVRHENADDTGDCRSRQRGENSPRNSMLLDT